MRRGGAKGAVGEAPGHGAAVRAIPSEHQYHFKFILVGDSGVGKSCLLLQLTDGSFNESRSSTIGVEFGTRVLEFPLVTGAPEPSQSFADLVECLTRSAADGNRAEAARTGPLVPLSPEASPVALSSSPAPHQAHHRQQQQQQQWARAKVHIWDTAGQETFRSITRSYYRGACGALLVFDATSRESLQHCHQWLQDVVSYSSMQMTVMLVANKCDLLLSGTDAESAEEQRLAELYGEVETFARQHDLLFIFTSARSGFNVEAAFTQLSQRVVQKVRSGILDSYTLTGRPVEVAPAPNPAVPASTAESNRRNARAGSVSSPASPGMSRMASGTTAQSMAVRRLGSDGGSSSSSSSSGAPLHPHDRVGGTADAAMSYHRYGDAGGGGAPSFPSRSVRLGSSAAGAWPPPSPEERRCC